MIRSKDSNPHKEKKDEYKQHEKNMMDSVSSGKLSQNLSLRDAQKLVDMWKYWGSEYPVPLPDNDPDTILRGMSKYVIPYLTYIITEDSQASTLVKVAAVRALSYITSAAVEIESAMSRAIISEDHAVAVEATRAVAKYGPQSEKMVKALITVLESHETYWRTKVYACRALAKTALSELNPDEFLYKRALQKNPLTAYLHKTSFRKVFINHFEYEHPAVRIAAVLAIGELGPFKGNIGIGPIMDMLEYDIRIVRLATASALGRLGCRLGDDISKASSVLLSFLSDEVRYHRGLGILGWCAGDVDLTSLIRTGVIDEYMKLTTTISKTLESRPGSGIDVTLEAMKGISIDIYSEGVEFVQKQSNSPLTNDAETLRQSRLDGSRCFPTLLEAKDPRAWWETKKALLENAPRLDDFIRSLEDLNDLWLKSDFEKRDNYPKHKGITYKLCYTIQHIAQLAASLSENDLETAASDAVYAASTYLIEDIRCDWRSSFWSYFYPHPDPLRTYRSETPAFPIEARKLLLEAAGLFCECAKGSVA